MATQQNKQAFCAWAAGFFDGDGSLTIHVLSRYGKDNTHEVRVVLQLTQKFVKPLRLLKQKWGGYIIRIARQKGMSKDYSKWHLTGREKLTLFLTEILPYVCVKSNQVRLALSVLGWQKPRGAMGGRLPTQNGRMRARVFYKGRELRRFRMAKRKMETLNRIG